MNASYVIAVLQRGIRVSRVRGLLARIASGTPDPGAVLRLPKGGVIGGTILSEGRLMSAFDRRVDPEVREVRRLEVINGALGRRRWSTVDAKRKSPKSAD